MNFTAINKSMLNLEMGENIVTGYGTFWRLYII